MSDPSAAAADDVIPAEDARTDLLSLDCLVFSLPGLCFTGYASEDEAGCEDSSTTVSGLAEEDCAAPLLRFLGGARPPRTWAADDVIADDTDITEAVVPGLWPEPDARVRLPLASPAEEPSRGTSGIEDSGIGAVLSGGSYMGAAGLATGNGMATSAGDEEMIGVTLGVSLARAAAAAAGGAMRSLKSSSSWACISGGGAFTSKTSPSPSPAMTTGMTFAIRLQALSGPEKFSRPSST